MIPHIIIAFDFEIIFMYSNSILHYSWQIIYAIIGSKINIYRILAPEESDTAYTVVNSPWLPFPLQTVTTAGRRAFSCAGPSAWNSLPEYLTVEVC